MPFLDQFTRHRGEHVVIVVDTLQAFSGKLAFHGESRERVCPNRSFRRNETLRHEVQSPMIPDLLIGRLLIAKAVWSLWGNGQSLSRPE